MAFSFRQATHSIRLITFDCYGTLIDWKAGLERSIRSAVNEIDDRTMRQVFHNYVAAEAQVEAGPYRSYREVMASALELVARKHSLSLKHGWHEAFPESLRTWEPFPDTVNALRRLKARFQLAVLSNIDRDLFASSAEKLQVPFDFVITAQDVGSYKPAHGHFLRMLERWGDRSTVLHAGQSLLHDARPCGELSLAFALINRYKDQHGRGASQLAEFDSLAALADALLDDPARSKST